MKIQLLSLLVELDLILTLYFLIGKLTLFFYFIQVTCTMQSIESVSKLVREFFNINNTVEAA